jgi:hypothetical protein
MRSNAVFECGYWIQTRRMWMLVDVALGIASCAGINMFTRTSVEIRGCYQLRICTIVETDFEPKLKSIAN